MLNFELLHTHHLPDFPSASSINFHDGKLYLVGDDANTILIVNTDYDVIEQRPLFDYPGKRMSKSEKADLESSVLININDKLHLVAFGSASRENRKKIISMPADNSKDLTITDNSTFIERLRQKGIAEINIEGATLVGDFLLFVNRGNNSYRKNHLITTTADFWKHQEKSPVLISEVITPGNADTFNGISEIHYVQSKDILLFTLTSEATANAYDDGTIGDSYIGWIRSAANSPMNVLHGMTNLSHIHPEFKGQKIEGLCAEPSGENELILHLVADNDSGESKIFKVRMKIN